MWKTLDEEQYRGAPILRTEASQIEGIGVLIRSVGPTGMSVVFVPGARLYTSSDGKTTLQGAK